MPEDQDGVVARIGGLAVALRAEGLSVGTGQVIAFMRALGGLDLAQRDDVYHAGRACLTTARVQWPVYDRVFEDHFARGPEPPDGPTAAPQPSSGGVADPSTQPGAPLDALEVGAAASSVERLRRRDLAACSEEELARIAGAVAGLELRLPVRRSRRTRPARAGGAIDMRRTARRAQRTRGEVVDLLRSDARTRRRGLVLIIDVSGSMAAYSRVLLALGHAATRLPVAVECFCFATRLTRVTASVAAPRLQDAIVAATGRVVDLDGGTRIGDALREFNRRYAGTRVARGAVVVVCSDGLERGDPDALGVQAARLRRVAHRLVWVNPLAGDPAYRPIARGMAAALPSIDELRCGHDLDSVEALAQRLPELVAGACHKTAGAPVRSRRAAATTMVTKGESTR